MNYRHAFHAGNFADVHKHIALILLLEHLKKKPAPFFVLDTHAGRGSYDLNSEEALRGDEWRSGVARLKETAQSALFDNYMAIAHSTPDHYLGSPLIAASLLRATDRAVFVEKHPEEAAALRDAVGKRKQVAVINDDGYASLKAYLPPKENRGLVLIDPPYEAPDEFERLAKSLTAAHARWPNGIYFAWYPIKAEAAHARFHQQLRTSGIKKILVSELCVKPADSPLSLNGSGLLLINPPFQMDEQLKSICAELRPTLSPQGSVRTAWLVGE